MERAHARTAAVAAEPEVEARLERGRRRGAVLEREAHAAPEAAARGHARVSCELARELDGAGIGGHRGRGGRGGR